LTFDSFASDTYLSDLYVIGLLTLSMAVGRVLLVHWLVPNNLGAQQMEALVRCKSMHLLSADYKQSLTPRAETPRSVISLEALNQRLLVQQQRQEQQMSTSTANDKSKTTKMNLPSLPPLPNWDDGRAGGNIIRQQRQKGGLPNTALKHRAAVAQDLTTSGTDDIDKKKKDLDIGSAPAKMGGFLQSCAPTDYDSDDHALADDSENDLDIDEEDDSNPYHPLPPGLRSASHQQQYYGSLPPLAMPPPPPRMENVMGSKDMDDNEGDDEEEGARGEEEHQDFEWQRRGSTASLAAAAAAAVQELTDDDDEDEEEEYEHEHEHDRNFRTIHTTNASPNSGFRDNSGSPVSPASTPRRVVVGGGRPQRLFAAPRYATAVFRLIYCVISCTMAWYLFRDADFWPWYVGGHGLTARCWDLSGSLALAKNLDSDFDHRNTVLRRFFLVQASYHLHSGAFHVFSVLLLHYLKRGDNEDDIGGGDKSTNKKRKKQWTALLRSLIQPRALLQHSLSLFFLCVSYVFSSLRRLGAIAMFALDMSSIALHLLQTCLNAPTDSVLSRPKVVKSVWALLVIPSFLYFRFWVWPMVGYSAVVESEQWLTQLESTLVPGSAQWFRRTSQVWMALWMGFHAIRFKRLVFHPHIQRMSSSSTSVPTTTTSS